MGNHLYSIKKKKNRMNEKYLLFKSPMLVLFILLLLLFVTEFILLSVLNRYFQFSRIWMSLINAVFLIALISAPLFYLLFFPMLRYIHTLEMTRKELIVAKERAESANLAKIRFLANISHELRTPMNAVLGMSKLLETTSLSSNQKQYLQTINSSGKSLINLFNDLLDFSKIDSGKFSLNQMDFDLRIMLDEITDILNYKASDKRLQFMTIVDSHVPSSVTGDPSRIKQIILNLGNNAIKFTDQGNVIVEVKNKGEDKTKVNLLFTVKDTGIGIDQDKLNEIFKPFYQVDSSASRKFEGTGLGLAISKNLVEMMNGTIEVESNLGKGTRFYFSIPLDKQAKRDQSLLSKKYSVTDQNILIYSSNPYSCKVLKQQFKYLKIKNKVIKKTEEVLTQLKQAYAADQMFTVLIIDLDILDPRTEEIGRQIKNDFQLKNLKLILLTSFGIKGDVEKLSKIGFNAYLSKPVKWIQLKECLELVFNEKIEGAPESIVTKYRLKEMNRQNIKILVVDDHELNLEVMVKILNLYGMHGDTALNGEAALELVKDHDYHIIFIDIQMPGMDGFETTKQIRMVEKKASPQIFALTANVMEKNIKNCFDCGMNGFLAKPVDTEKLLRIINMVYQDMNKINIKNEIDT